MCFIQDRTVRISSGCTLVFRCSARYKVKVSIIINLQRNMFRVLPRYYPVDRRHKIHYSKLGTHSHFNSRCCTNSAWTPYSQHLSSISTRNFWNEPASVTRLIASSSNRGPLDCIKIQPGSSKEYIKDTIGNFLALTLNSR